ncbi:lantibiotic dehydratase [Streptacidiphilus sp. P02-A3a]|uniref:lantibiotic dehydratase n=1 Tax=Streptacidiphilus sp. P02-A3a TaxID=2704468 RepID=UPI0015FCCF1F|nr:lantibiotic dehydratase [Streptacidiphilus sp. P02-A3a]QMU73262.1 lantibiotic dehydratase [Streptacidiphilus sp. P02-A3a]
MPSRSEPSRAEPSRAGRPAGYVCAEPVVLRAALLPRAQPTRYGDGSRPADDPALLDDLRRTFREQPTLAAALELAAPALAAGLDPGRDPGAAADRRRAVLALTGYLLRARHRATPFGLFAGTALVRTGAAAQGALGDRHRALLRPAPGWQAALAAATPGADVRLATARSLHRHGSGYALPVPTGGGPGRWQLQRTLRRTPLVDAVLALASGSGGRRGIGRSALLDLLCAAAPGADREQRARQLDELLDSGFLSGDLRPPPGSADPLGHLLARLTGHPLAAPLAELRHELGSEPGHELEREPGHEPGRSRQAPPTAGRLRTLRARLAAVHRPQAALTADTLLDTTLRLPRPVVTEVERAASAAWRCAPPRPDRTLAGLHLAMLERYGADRPVPLPELLDPVRSLGLHRARPAAPEPVPAERDRFLSDLALAALADGRAELRLDRRRRTRLAELSGQHAEPPSADVYAEVVTAGAAELDRGEFLVVLGAHTGPGPAGSVTGRLSAVLGRPGGDPLPSGTGTDTGEGTGPVTAEVVSHPPDPRAWQLLAETGWTDYRIDLTDHPPRPTDRDLALDDLLLTATRGGLTLRSRRLGREVRPVGCATLDPRRTSGPAQLLLALGRAGRTPWRAWDWGAAEALPWLPRVSLGRAVLAPARWLVPAELLLLAEDATDRRWRHGVDRWREAWRLPETVLAGRGDQRLPLDLDDPVHLALLRRACRGRDTVAVTEPPGGVAAWRATGWPRGPHGPHTAEFVLPLRPVPRQAVPVAPAVPAAEVPDEVHLPGGRWLCAALSAPAELHDRVLAELADEALRAAVERAGVDRWFFVRAADDAGVPQLRLRFHGRPERLHPVLLPALHGWAEALRSAGLIRDLTLTAYRPERARYGGGGCLAAAERFFGADSRLALDLLATARDPRQAVVPGVLRLLTVLLGSEQAVAELPEPRLDTAERRAFARLRPVLRGQAGDAGWPPATVTSHGRGAQSAAHDWLTALSAYRSRLRVAGAEPGPVARSLVHLHCNRLAGPDRSVERVAVALARDLALTRSLTTG